MQAKGGVLEGKELSNATLTFKKKKKKKACNTETGFITHTLRSLIFDKNSIFV